MIVVKKRPVPTYEVTCSECQSVLRYTAAEVFWHHITCPVCHVSLWANTLSPVVYQEEDT